MHGSGHDINTFTAELTAGLDSLSVAMEAMDIQRVQDSKKTNEEEYRMKDYNGSCKDKCAKRFKKQEQEGNLENLKALLEKPVKTNIKWLHEKINRFNLDDKRIEGLEAKIHALFYEDEDKDFKNDRDERKKSFLYLLKQYDESDNGYEALKEVKIKAVQQGINLSRLVVDLMFLNFMPEDNDMLVKLQVLEASLTWVFQGEVSVVVRRILDLIVTAGGEMRKMKESKKALMLNAVKIDEEWFVNSRNKDEVIVEEANSHRVNQVLEEALIEDHADKPILLLLKQILCSECLWMLRRFPDSKISLKDAIPLLLVEILECEEAQKLIENKVKNLIKLYASWFGEEVLNMKETKEYKAMNTKINELWNRIDESEE